MHSALLWASCNNQVRAVARYEGLSYIVAVVNKLLHEDEDKNNRKIVFPQAATEGLLELVKPRLPSPQLPEFFWCHLEKDLQLLGRATGKSVDEAAIILHLVIRGILTQEPPGGTSALFLSSCMQFYNHNLYSGSADTVGVVSTLRARNARQEWERIFNQVYIQPVLEVLSQNWVLPH